MDGQATSNAAQPLDFDFWEFVTCAKCHLDFSSDGISMPSVPFWITECGHILCNSHLNADQSCPSCNAQSIELMPLQKEMPPPMSDWFCSAPFKLDALAQAVKFQQESMAASVRYYKSRCAQYRMVVERMKNEIVGVKAVKKENESLKHENAQLRSGQGVQQQQQQQMRMEPDQYTNVNGKRRLVDHRVSTSSPRSIHTPLGPPRITLPPDHDPPPSFAKGGSDGSGALRNPQRDVARDRPVSSQFVQQYAYNPPQALQMQMRSQQVLPHSKQAPMRQVAGQVQAQNHGQSDRRLMPPPPTPIHARQQQALPQSRQAQRVATTRVPEQGNQDPSHMPSIAHQRYFPALEGNRQAQAQSLNQTPGRFFPTSASGKRFELPMQMTAPSSRSFVPSTPSSDQRRFVPSASGSRTAPPAPVSSSARGAHAGFTHTHAQSQRAAFAPSR